VARERRPPHDFAPRRARKRVDRRQRARIAHVDRARLGIVPFEERRLDVESTDDGTDAKADDAPVVIAAVASAARFPAVHPLASLGVLAFDPDRRGWIDEPFL